MKKGRWGKVNSLCVNHQWPLWTVKDITVCFPAIQQQKASSYVHMACSRSGFLHIHSSTWMGQVCLFFICSSRLKNSLHLYNSYIAKCFKYVQIIPFVESNWFFLCSKIMPFFTSSNRTYCYRSLIAFAASHQQLLESFPNGNTSQEISRISPQITVYQNGLWHQKAFWRSLIYER